MKIWIYINGAQQGPYDDSQLPGLPIGPDTPVWYEGLPQWMPARQAPATARIFASHEQPQQPEQPTYTTTYPAAATQQYQQQQYQYQQQYQQQYGSTGIDRCPPTFLALSIITALCCCTPLSIAAIICSVSVTSRYRRGDIEGARRMSETVEWLIIISIVLGLIFLPFSAIFYL